MIIASVLGDIHLSPHIWTRFPHVRDDSAVGYESFIQEAIGVGAPIIIAGDLFDVAKPPPDLVSICRAGLDRCQEAGVPVYVYQGNHDKQETPWVCAIHDYPVYVGDGKPFRLGSRWAIAFDYQLMDDIKSLIDQIPQHVEVAFLHQAARQALAFDGAWNCDLEWLPSSIKTCILGDIHQPLDMRLSDGRLTHYTGAGHARDIGQIGPKSFLELHDDLTITRHPIPSRAIKKFVVTAPADIASVADWLASAAPVVYGPRTLLPFAWVVYSPEHASAIQDLQSTFVHAGRALMFADLATSTETALDVAAEPGDFEAVDLASALPRFVDRNADPVLFQLLLDVLQSKRALDVVSSYRDKVISNG